MRNLPKSHQGKNIKNFTQKKLKKDCCEWCGSSKWCLTLHGTPGTGKTHLAVALAEGYEKIINPGCDAYFLPMFEFIAEIRNAQLESKSEFRIIEKYAEIDFLIMDDLGAMENTQSQKDKINDLIDRRYRYRKKTVITSNLTWEAIQETYSERTIRRLSDEADEFEMIKK